MKKALTYVGIILGFLVLSYAFVPQVLGGKIVNQSDISGWQGMAHEMMTWNKENPDNQTAWTDAMFVPASCTWWAKDFWRNYESVRRTGGFFWFWGHSCELGDDNALWDKYEGMLQRISSDRDATWIDPIDLFVGKQDRA